MLYGRVVFCLVAFLHIAFMTGCVSTSTKKVSPSEVATANVNLAAEYFRLGRMEDALRSAKKAVNADSDSASANSLLALIYQQLEESSLADEYFAKAVDVVAHDSSEYGMIHNNYGVFLCQKGMLLDAEEHFLLAAKNKMYRTPESAFENAGLCAIKANKVKLAEEYFGKSLALAPNMSRSLVELAKIYYRAEKYQLAREYIQRYLASHTGDAGILFFAQEIEQKLESQNDAKRLKSEP